MIDFDFWFDCFEKGFPLEQELPSGNLSCNLTSVVFKAKTSCREKPLIRGMCKKEFVKAMEFVLNGKQ